MQINARYFSTTDRNVACERRMGQLLDGVISKGGDPKSHGATLADIGLNKMQSHRWQVLAKGSDDGCRKTAIRIQARAIRRCGELLQEYNKGVGQPKKNGSGADPISQRAAAEQAGMSKRQEVTAALMPLR